MDELGPGARDVLRVARDARTPSAEDRARVERKLAAAIAIGAGAAVGGAAGSAAASGAGAAAAGAGAGAWLVKGLGAMLVVGVVGAGAVVATRTTTTPSQEPAHEVIAPPEVAPVDLEEAPIEPPHEEIAAAEEQVVDAPEAPRRARRRAAATSSSEDLAEELELLHSAQRAWRAGDGARTLALVSEHEDRFARSQMAPERTALRILALCDVGREAEARRLATRFLRTARQSPLRRSVEESCAAR
ncbi:hypothetical protein [Sandaracinus amylolyticus]|uniref:hypothetical protein n=1 Tax=Sandaracinus amylolyticus TaxID=927083 RepID=UPI001F240A62|nr:hypothetical protein [Sandaracinus amylolyticus]UJR85446.1 Hypothetical protein I5071_75260 [Sandaracinus amylolyticus]